MTDIAWNSFEFGLEGACNTKGDYSADGFAVPTVTVTWSYVPHPETDGATMLPENAATDVAPSIATTTYTMVADQAITIPVSLGNGTLTATGVASVTYNGTSVLGKLITYDDGVVTVPATTVNNLIGKTGDQTIVIVFDDDASTSVTVTFEH